MSLCDYVTYVRMRSKLFYLIGYFFVSVHVYDGELLNLTKISRTEMGAYLCIATNGVPPSVSKRIIVDVECKSSKTS